MVADDQTIHEMKEFLLWKVSRELSKWLLNQTITLWKITEKQGKFL